MTQICLDAYTYTHIRTHARTHARTHTYTHARTHARTHTLTHTLSAGSAHYRRHCCKLIAVVTYSSLFRIEVITWYLFVLFELTYQVHLRFVDDDIYLDVLIWKRKTAYRPNGLCLPARQELSDVDYLPDSCCVCTKGLL